VFAIAVFLPVIQKLIFKLPVLAADFVSLGSARLVAAVDAALLIPPIILGPIISILIE
jgi:hypothetical protein